MGIFSLFGIGNSKIKDAVRHGATIIDIRPAGEFDQGKIRRALNIPLDRLEINLDRIRFMRRPIIVCGHSEADSEQAINYLKDNGIKDLHNGGNWERLLKIIRSL